MRERQLAPPKPERNFLISPPGSPPVGWEQAQEEPPNSAPLAEDLIHALKALQLKQEDFSTLASLAEEAARLPETGSVMNAWRVAHDRTSQKIDRLFARAPSGELRQVSVQGWHAEKKKLQTAVGEYEELPPVLQELFGYIQEGRTDYQRGQVDNADVIAKVKSLFNAQW